LQFELVEEPIRSLRPAAKLVAAEFGDPELQMDNFGLLTRDFGSLASDFQPLTLHLRPLAGDQGLVSGNIVG